MKRKQSFLIPLLMTLVMMAMSPQKGWAKEVTYRVPVYKTAGDPKSGIASWEIKTVDAALVTESVTKQQNTNSPILEAGWYYVSGQATITGGVLCTGDVHLILCDGANLTVTGATVGYGYGIGIANTGSLTIYAQSEGENMGALSATGNRYYAGIGSTSYQVCNSITINGGKITATGADDSAGIGGSQDQSGCKNITINGGMVTAIGGRNAAGIGGGSSGKFYNLTINGGVVKASSSNCVAISAGNSGYIYSPSVIIGTDGWIKAGDNASSLSQVTNDGSNFYDNYSNHMSFWKKYVEIHVNTYASETAEEAYLKTAANCTDDAVYYHKCAYCDASSENKTNSTWAKTGSAIGHGSEGYTDTYTWTGTCYNDDTQDTKACTFTLQCNKCSTKVVDGISLDCTKGAHTDATCTVAGSTTYSATGSYTSTNSEYNYSDTKTHDYTIAAIGHTFTNYIYNNDATCTKGGTKTASCDNECGATDTQDAPEHPAAGHTFTTYTYNNDATCTKAGTKTASCDYGCGKKDTKDDPEHPATGVHTFTNYIYNNDATCTKAGTKTASCDYGCGATDTKNDPEHPAEGHTFTNYIYNNDATCVKAGTMTATCGNGCGATDTKDDPEHTNAGHNFVNGTCTICNKTLVGITYRVPTYNTTGDPTSGIASWSNETAEAIPVTSSEKQEVWNAGWYYVSGMVGLTKGVVCNGDVHLILCDNASLTVTNVNSQEAGICVSGTENKLTIYAQSEGALMGALWTMGSEDGAGIGGGNNGSGNNITINGGVINATGKESAGIGGGHCGSGINITINGGTVTANSQAYGAGIGGGQLKGNGQNITINGGTVTASSSKYGAGIGGGSDGNGTNITISGGNVTANGGIWGAGIGGGRYGSANNLTIKSGNVTANGGDNASGIGCGKGGGICNNITINTNLTTKAGSSANPTDGVTNTDDDLASQLTDKQYATVHLHQDGESVWKWASDGSEATLTIGCSFGDGEQVALNTTTTPAVNITSEGPTKATYTTPGTTTYHASVTYNGTPYNAPEKVEVIIPTIKRAFTSVEQDGTKIASLGTAAFDINEDTEVTLEFDNEGNAVVTIGGNTVAKVPAQGDMVMDFTTTMTENELNKVSKTVTAAGYATLYSPFQLAIPAEGTVEGYAPTYDASTHTLSLKGDNKVNGSIIPAGTGVLLKNAGTATFTISADAPTYTDVSALTGSAVKMANPTKAGEVGGMTVYTLGKNSSNAYGFFRYTGDNLNAGSAFLYIETLPTEGNVKGINLVFDDDTTSIKQISPLGESEGAVKYLENGRIVILKNGKKYNANGQRIK